MKILQITTDFPFKSNGKIVSYGGLGVCVSQLIDGIKSIGWDVTVLSRQDKEIDSELYDVVRSNYIYFSDSRNWKLTHSFTLIPKLVWLLYTKKYDIVHVHNPPAALFSTPIAKMFGLSVILTMHGPWAKVRDKMSWLARVIEDISLNNADIVTFDSFSLMNEYIYKPKYFAIQNAVDTTIFKKFNKQRCREILGLPKNGKLVLYSGRNVFGKNTETIKDLAFRLPDVNFVVAGQTIDGPNNIINLGFIQNSSMNILYNSCDCLILDSAAEGMSRAVLEAMACGCAVFLSDITSNHEILGNSFSGLIFKDIKDLQTLISFLTIEDMEMMGEEGIEHIEEHFRSIDRIIKFLDIYQWHSQIPSVEHCSKSTTI